MRKISVDFGTGNTVLAAYNESDREVETCEIPGITRAFRYVPPGESVEQLVHVVPSLVHFVDGEVLVGEEVVSRGLEKDPTTFRWMKSQIGEVNRSRKVVASGERKTYREAGKAFLGKVLRKAFPDSEPDSFARDEFTFTAPVEAFEHFHDWLREFGEEEGITHLRVLDEPTAAILGYEGTARRDEKFLVFDFGCGTLDVQVVSVDLAARGERKVVQKGQAGERCGGMLIDLALARDFADRHRLSFDEMRELDPLLIRRVEELKIALSDPNAVTGDLTLPYERSGRMQILRTSYSRSCGHCERGEPGAHESSEAGCFGCVLLEQRFPQKTRQTLELALENAAIKNVRRSEIKRVVVTGGTSLIPYVRQLLEESFPPSADGESRVEYARVFDAVARGAGLGDVTPVLQHDYGIRSFDEDSGEKLYSELFRQGDEYPTEVVSRWAVGTFDGMRQISMIFVERSQLQRMNLAQSVADAEGLLLPGRSHASELVEFDLNGHRPTFIEADPPVNVNSDQQRFLCEFQVDENRRLLVTVIDNVARKTLMEKEPVIRLDRIRNPVTR